MYYEPTTVDLEHRLFYTHHREFYSSINPWKFVKSVVHLISVEIREIRGSSYICGNSWKSVKSVKSVVHLISMEIREIRGSSYICGNSWKFMEIRGNS